MDLQTAAIQIVTRLVEAGHEAYFVGGWVRDYLLGHPRADIDIATAAAPEEVIALFKHTVPVGVQFGVVIVVEDGHNFEVSSFRKDGLYVDGRRPEGIAYATAREDVARRDFTINGIFYDPLTDSIYDWVEGRKDLKKKVIRAIGTAAKRFREDRLRMIRAVRIASRLQFTLDPETEAAICEQASTLFPAVAMERVWAEFQKMEGTLYFTKALVMMHRLNILQQIFPQLSEIATEVFEERLSPLTRMPIETPVIAQLAELFPDLTKNERKQLAVHLKARNSDGKILDQLWHGRQLIERERSGTPPERADWIRYYAIPDALLYITIILARYGDTKKLLSQHQERYETYRKHIERIEKKHPLLDAARLKKEGIIPGKIMGLLLKEGERIAINNNLHDADVVLEHLRMMPLWKRER